MEENDKVLELALKIGDSCNEYSVGEALQAIEVVVKSVIDGFVDDDFDKIKAYNMLIKAFSKQTIKITANRKS